MNKQLIFQYSWNNITVSLPQKVNKWYWISTGIGTMPLLELMEFIVNWISSNKLYRNLLKYTKFSFKKMQLKRSVKCGPFCLRLCVLMQNYSVSIAKELEIPQSCNKATDISYLVPLLIGYPLRPLRPEGPNFWYQTWNQTMIKSDKSTLGRVIPLGIA